jgi:Ser/Thr protein kinase RdoA (MazF antagonist)
METYMQAHLTDAVRQEAAAKYGIQASDLRPIGGFENAVYEYRIGNEDYIMRLVHSGHRSFQLVLGELEFIDYLDRNHARVSTVIPDQQGNLAVQVSIDDIHYFTVCVFTKAPGTFVSPTDLTPEFWTMFGTEVARLHELTTTYVPLHRRMEWFEENFWDLADRVLDAEDQDIRVLLDVVTKTIRQFPVQSDNYGLIHTCSIMRDN